MPSGSPPLPLLAAPLPQLAPKTKTSAKPAAIKQVRPRLFPLLPKRFMITIFSQYRNNGSIYPQLQPYINTPAKISCLVLF
jgi:hypothetical protein